MILAWDTVSMAGSGPSDSRYLVAASSIVERKLALGIVGTECPHPHRQPALTHLSNPGAQEADAHLPIVIQVGVQAATALGEVAEVGGHGRVDIGELDVEQVEAILVGGASGALDQGREEVLEGGTGREWGG